MNTPYDMAITWITLLNIFGSNLDHGLKYLDQKFRKQKEVSINNSIPLT